MIKRFVWLSILLTWFAAIGCSESYYPCQNHWNCPDDMVCEDGRCIADDGRPRVCTMDIQCRLGERCRAGVCSTDPDCTSDFDCTEGTYCHILSGDCVPDRIPCDGDADCPPGMRCDVMQEACVPAGCQTDGDCAPGQVCEPGSGTCGTIGPECETDADCLPGQRCDTLAGVCRAGGCISDTDCLGGQYCDNASGVCRYPGAGCTSDAECGAGVWCEVGTGQCRTGCRADADCPPGTNCVVVSGECETPSGCTSDAECPQGHSCQLADGLCVPISGQVPDGSPCQYNEDCDSRNCVPVTNPPVCLSPCRSSAGCAPGWSCAAVTSANYCISSQLLTQLHGIPITVGHGEYGDGCSGPAVYNPGCHSLICHQNLGMCTTDCTSDADCGRVPGSICRLNYETGIMRAYCFLDVGFTPPGYACDDNYYCSLGICFAGVYACSNGCCSSMDCAPGWACGRIQSSDPQAPGYAKVCFPTDSTGPTSTGQACSADSQCRGGYCLDGTCTDLCCTDANCPNPMRCELFIDQSNLAFTMCN